MEASNPLEIHLILDRIFHHCSVRDLKVCRHVCKLWLKCSEKAWLSTAVVSLITHRSAPVTEMSKFLDFLEHPANNYSKPPFRGYSTNQDDKRFWRVCGPTVKYLELCWVEFDSVDSFRNAIYRSCPNLEELVLSNVETKGAKGLTVLRRMEEEDGEWEEVEEEEWEEPKFGKNTNLKSLTVNLAPGEFLGVSWMELLNHFSNLESLKLRGSYGPFAGFWKSFNKIRQQDPSKLKLKHLDTQGFEDWENRDLLNILRNKDFHFQSLTIRLPDSFTEEDVRAILIIHKSSLKKLDLFRSGGRTMNAMKTFPDDSLENLHELVLHSRIFSSYRFLQFMPNLKKLKLAYRSAAAFLGNEVDNLSCVRLNHCKEITIRSTQWETGDAEIEFLLTCLPYVERVIMPLLCNYMFDIYSKPWANLVSLEN